MACGNERLMTLPIKDEIKQGMAQFCSNPENEEQCQIWCETPDAELVEQINSIEGQMNQWNEQGMPPELDQGLQQAEMGGADPQEPQGGIAGLEGAPPSQSPQQVMPPGITPAQMSEVPMPMDTPQEPQAPRGYARGGLATLHREPQMKDGVPAYGLGGWLKKTVKKAGNSIKKRTGKLGALGGIVGAAMAWSTGGMSLAWGAGYGAAAGSFIETGGDLKAALGAGLTGYGLGSAFSGATGIKGGTGNGFTGGNAAGAGAGTPQPTANPAAKISNAGTNFANSTAGVSTHNPLGGADLMDTLPRGEIPWYEKGLNTAQAYGNEAMDYAKENPWKVGLGATYIAGALEEGEEAEKPKDVLGDYNKCVAENGYANCVRPPELQFASQGVGINAAAGAPQAQQHQYAYQQAQPRGPQAQGIAQLAQGGQIQGPGSGTSDEIPAYLSNNEFVMTADAVRGAGQGNMERGAEHMYRMMNQFEQAGQR